MKRAGRHIALYGIRIFLMTFWLYVALDKLWQLSSFRISLQQQPVLHDFASVLYWMLPSVELGIALLFIVYRDQKNLPFPEERNISFFLSPFLLSALLMAAFTLYIGLGVAGFYPKKPCMCSSFLQNITWTRHLLINFGLLALSLLGCWLARDPNSTKHNAPSFRQAVLLLLYTVPSVIGAVHSNRSGVRTNAIHYPRKFAVFGRCTASGPTG